MTAQVRATIGHLKLQPEDAAMSALALQYAETIDGAAALAEEAAGLPYDPDTVVMVSRLKQRVEAHVVMVDLGPKLQAALDALGATPKSRMLAGKPAPAAGKSRLTQLREGAAS
ncbi:terminase small subunit [Pseudonocardia broussonetiae]|uniref:Terminase small subunit actinomycetes phage-type domain-containing protein n=1 Tax=Pseudonocardia broussonetiae TaxID=2736640 RepID=A0A6M6JW49_9PSEU|nr:hypothetical protein [Pseudonocardia broussonetiae]QJY51226.1 hypothetical protein HOP40_35180 [Pseudonocardia broussonetiae]